MVCILSFPPILPFLLVLGSHTKKLISVFFLVTPSYSFLKFPADILEKGIETSLSLCVSAAEGLLRDFSVDLCVPD